MPTTREQIKTITDAFDATTNSKVSVLESDISLAGSDSETINTLVSTFRSDLQTRLATLNSDIDAVLNP